MQDSRAKLRAICKARWEATWTAMWTAPWTLTRRMRCSKGTRVWQRHGPDHGLSQTLPLSAPPPTCSRLSQTILATNPLKESSPSTRSRLLAPSSPPPFRLPLCIQTCTSSRSMRAHFDKHHDPVPPLVWHCSHENCVSKNKAPGTNLPRHGRLVHESSTATEVQAVCAR